MEKDQKITLTIEDMLDDGRCFARCDGFAVFVSGGGVIGDVIEAKVTKVKKSAAEANLTRIVTPSKSRVKAECKYFGQCGGCTLQEMSYEAQLEMKENHVKSKLERLGGIENPEVKPIVGAETQLYYRNKATFAVGPHGEVGFLKGKSHRVIDIDDCLLQTDPAMVCADALRTFLKKHKMNCIKQLIVKTAFGTGDVLVAIESEKKKIPEVEELIEMLDDGVYSIGVDGDDEPIEGTEQYRLSSVSVIHKGKATLLAGFPTITDKVIRLDGTELKYEIGPQSFYQVNQEQMAKLYDKVAEYAALTGKETVLDLYCGVGTIGIWLADKAEIVYGIESVKPAVIDANRNSVINTLVNTRYICGKSEEELPGMMGLAKLYKWNEVNERVERQPLYHIDKVDVAVLDPPRAGCEEALLEAVVKAEPERIVYVSCDPGTLARDVKYLVANGYEFKEVTPVDQFPQTGHVETVTLLSKLYSSQHIDVEINLEEMDLTSAESKATYEEIRNYVMEHTGLRVPNLYIAQVKRKYGLVERINYNLPKSDDSSQPQCPAEKVKAIEDALKFFQMI